MQVCLLPLTAANNGCDNCDMGPSESYSGIFLQMHCADSYQTIPKILHFTNTSIPISKYHDVQIQGGKFLDWQKKTLPLAYNSWGLMHGVFEPMKKVWESKVIRVKRVWESNITGSQKLGSQKSFVIKRV